MNNPPIPIKLAMAHVIARKIMENPGKFDCELAEAAKDFTSASQVDYWSSDVTLVKGIPNRERWETDATYWQPIRGRLPEILEKLAGDK